MGDIKSSRSQHILSAREIRQHPTPAEAGLWKVLRDRKLSGLKFYRQRVVRPVTADFYCATARLVVEVDGEIHDFQGGYDSARITLLEDYGYQVIRFRNERVINELEQVLSEIKGVAFNRIKELESSSSHDSDLTPNPPSSQKPLRMLRSPEVRRGESASDGGKFGARLEQTSQRMQTISSEVETASSPDLKPHPRTPI